MNNLIPGDILKSIIYLMDAEYISIIERTCKLWKKISRERKILKSQRIFKYKTLYQFKCYENLSECLINFKVDNIFNHPKDLPGKLHTVKLVAQDYTHSSFISCINWINHNFELIIETSNEVIKRDDNSIYFNILNSNTFIINFIHQHEPTIIHIILNNMEFLEIPFLVKRISKNSILLRITKSTSIHIIKHLIFELPENFDEIIKNIQDQEILKNLFVSPNVHELTFIYSPKHHSFIELCNLVIEKKIPNINFKLKN